MLDKMAACLKCGGAKARTNMLAQVQVRCDLEDRAGLKI